VVGPQLRAAIRVVPVSILSVGGVGRFRSAARARSGRPHISDGRASLFGEGSFTGPERTPVAA
jgi:hypothetical protein